MVHFLLVSREVMFPGLSFHSCVWAQGAWPQKAGASVDDTSVPSQRWGCYG